MREEYQRTARWLHRLFCLICVVVLAIGLQSSVPDARECAILELRTFLDIPWIEYFFRAESHAATPATSTPDLVLGVPTKRERSVADALGVGFPPGLKIRFREPAPIVSIDFVELRTQLIHGTLEDYDRILSSEVPLHFLRPVVNDLVAGENRQAIVSADLRNQGVRSVLDSADADDWLEIRYRVAPETLKPIGRTNPGWYAELESSVALTLDRESTGPLNWRSRAVLSPTSFNAIRLPLEWNPGPSVRAFTLGTLVLLPAASFGSFWFRLFLRAQASPLTTNFSHHQFITDNLLGLVLSATVVLAGIAASRWIPPRREPHRLSFVCFPWRGASH